MPTDFTTHLAVYQDGQQIAEKVIRVNDPLAVAGYTFHQNGFGPAPDVVIRDAEGRTLWAGPIPMSDQAAGFPFTEFAVPGREVVLQLLLQRAADGAGVVLVLPFQAAGTNADGTPAFIGLEPLALTRGESGTSAGTDFSVELRGFSEFTLLIAKKDPGQGLVWIAFGLLITGLLITFWMPRRRVWGRLDADGRLAMAVRADRYVDVSREFGRVLDDLVAVRRAG
jgi:cytochrome c biogenesis protein ResB